MNRIKVKTCAVLFAVFLISPSVYAGAQTETEPAIGDPVVGPEPQKVEDEIRTDPSGYTVETWVENLVIPWELLFLDGGRALVTERPGRIRLIKNGSLRDDPYLNLESEVVHAGEGGLMGLAAHPDFPAPPFLYVMYTYRSGLGLANGVARIRDYGDHGELEEFIIQDIPGGRIHDGGRIRFGPNGYLYISTGETGNPELAQDRESTAGKMLRIAADGSIPDGNPFPGSPVYSLGHRNPQGFDWHPDTGELFASEHGPSGEYGLRGHDNINVIRKGKNYGWPLSLGDANIEGYVDPVVMWKQATPPAGAVFHEGYFYLATLGSEALIRIRFSRTSGTSAGGGSSEEAEAGGWRAAEIIRLFAEDSYSGVYGRLRQVVVGPDNALYVLTSNRDGRGRVRPGDDKILRIE